MHMISEQFCKNKLIIEDKKQVPDIMYVKVIDNQRATSYSKNTYYNFQERLTFFNTVVLIIRTYWD